MPVVLVLVASVLFGTTGTARTLGLAGVDPVAVGAARLAVGGGCLGGIAAALALGGRLPRPTSFRRAGGNGRAGVLVGCGVLGVVGYQPAFFTGVQANGVAVGTLVALGSAPVSAGLASWALSRRFPGRRWLVATAGALVGVALLSGVGTGGPGAAVPAGLLASFGAGVAWATYTLAAKGLLERGWPPLTALGVVFGLAGLAGSLALALLPSEWHGLRTGLPAVLWLGLAATAMAYGLFTTGLTRLPAPTAATLTLAEPLVATLLGVAVLGERLSVIAVVGIVVLIVALGLLAAPTGTSPRRRRRDDSASLTSL